MNKFAERLRDLRVEKKLSQRDLAKATGFSQAAIARWENGLHIPNIDAAIIFAKFFNVTLDYIVGLVD